MLRVLASAIIGAVVLLLCALQVQAQDTVRVGLILPLTVQNTYVRKVERVDGQLYIVEFQTFAAVKKP